MNVKVNDYVKPGQIIGFGGNTGRSRGNHLHFELRYCDQTFDPEFLIDFEKGQLRSQFFALHKSYFNIRSRASEILEDVDEDGPGTVLANTDGLREISEAKYHVIREGDMLGKLAVRYGVTIDQICRLNNISRTTILRIGRSLRIQ